VHQILAMDPIPLGARAGVRAADAFDDAFSALFDAHFARVFRVIDRLTGDPELASDVTQDAFMRLYARGSLPQRPEAWLVTVALNRMRNAQSKRRRRARLLSAVRAENVQADAIPAPGTTAAAEQARARVRAALDRLDERARRLLLLHAEGYAYRDIAHALGLRESSVGTLIARARAAFRAACEERSDAT
jgi:RNA polymerase sigma factor (sigma-70 family)